MEPTLDDMRATKEQIDPAVEDTLIPALNDLEPQETEPPEPDYDDHVRPVPIYPTDLNFVDATDKLLEHKRYGLPGDDDDGE